MRVVLFGFLGGLLGVAIGDEDGFFFGLALGLLFAAVVRLRERVTALEQQLQRTAATDAPARVSTASIATPPAAPQPAPEPVIVAPPVTHAAPLPELDLPITDAWAAPVPPRAESAPSAFETKVRALLFGGNPVVRAGLVVLFFGVAFLFKFAAERQLVPVELRYLGVVAGACALLAIGWRQRVKRAGFAVLLQGGAVGLLYITVFAAMRLHALVPAPLAFALLIALVLLSGTLAVLQNARGLAVAGAVGGFLAPILVSTGAGNHVALFSYYALLNAGVVGIAWYRAWRVLNLVGFLFTFAIGGLWGWFDYRAELFWTTEPFLILFFLMYFALSILYARKQPAHPPVEGDAAYLNRWRTYYGGGYVDGTLVFGLPAIAFGLQAGMVREFEFALAWSAFGIAALYIGAAVSLWRRAGEGLRLLTEAFLALGVVFASLAIPLALEGRWTGAAWALEGTALVWVGVRQARVTARLFGLLLQAGAGFFFFTGVYYYGTVGMPLFNARFLGGLCLALGGLVSAYHLRRRDRLRSWEAPLEYVALGWGLAWWLGITADEIAQQLISDDWLHAEVALTALTAIVMSEASHRLAWRGLALPLSATAFVLLLLALNELSASHPFARLGVLSWTAAGSALYTVLRRQEGVLPPRVLGWQHQASLWLFTLLLAAEAAWGATQLAQGGTAWRLATWGVITPLMALLAIRASTRVAWPFVAYVRDYASEGPLPLLALSAAGCVVSALTVAGTPYPLSYIPVLNPLELAQIFVLLALVRWRLLAVAPRAVPPRVIDGAIGVTAFLVLNGMLARAVHFYTGVPFAWEFLLSTNELQTAFAVAWTLLALALTVIAARRGARELWLVGALLLGVVVVKLFVVDLASSNTVARIVSFLGVGALMLAIGFFAPLPPAARKEA